MHVGDGASSGRCAVTFDPVTDRQTLDISI